MTQSTSDTGPLGAPNFSFTAADCLHRFTALAIEKASFAEVASVITPLQSPWRSNAAMPHLFTRLAA
jgi:hypothetical protein